MKNNQKAGAWHLIGVTTDSGWKIVEPVNWDPKTGDLVDHYKGTGGNFSVPYIVEKNDHRAFLKAVDFTKALKSDDIMTELRDITVAHTFETQMLQICRGAQMDKVVVAIENGQLKIGSELSDIVPFLIFELANGDVRRRIQKKSGKHRLAWWLRAMHHAAVGLAQLHAKKITHQDLKPSNVLSFGEEIFKIADLGRCVSEDHNGPFDEMPFAGDWIYAPPEIVYGSINPEVFQRRLSCDLYQLGSLIFFFGNGLGATQILMKNIPLEQRPEIFKGGWTAGYNAILPMLQTVFTKMLHGLETELGEGNITAELVRAAFEMANPDPKLRGHPRSSKSGYQRYSLERYISLFDRLAGLSAIQARKPI